MAEGATAVAGASHSAFSVGILLAIGGTIGYIKKKSVPSFVAGIASGTLMVGAGLLINSGRNFEGHSLACTTSAVVAGAMASRATRTKKLMPAGAVASVGLLSAIYQGNKAWEWRG